MATSAVHRIIDVLEGYIPENIANPQVIQNPRWKSLKKKAASEQYEGHR
jgi:hypothetical protein